MINSEKVALAKELYSHHKKWVPAASFIVGFVFDLFTLGRIDSMANLAVQFLYIILIFVLLSYSLFAEHTEYQIPEKWMKAYSYKDEAVHFLMGSLFSSYLIFYFKSSSFWASFFILALLVLALLANETKQLRKSSIVLKFILFYFCALSFLLYFVPIILKNIGIISFILTVMLFTGLLFAHRWSYKKWIPQFEFKSNVLKPNLIFLVVFVLLYVAHFIPPVPLYVNKIGIYHKLEQKKDSYYFSYQRDWWKFWQDGAQDFVFAKDGSLYCFASVFSPSNFDDHVVFHWRYKTANNGWMTADRIQIKINGGRDQGFRAYSKKSKATEGEWQVLIETLRGREIGRISFEVSRGELDGEWKTDIF
ncbi:MAG: DUF2914 domain-containing protein [Bdellovibrionaceae bacterium]|nr:DUF2914 domain-containing protein [Pseudobdellovibrionaceae bacterium]